MTRILTIRSWIKRRRFDLGVTIRDYNRYGQGYHLDRREK